MNRRILNFLFAGLYTLTCWVAFPHAARADYWSLTHPILSPTAAEGDYFGAAVALDGDKILVGAYKDDVDAEDNGVAYLFDAKTGRLLHTLFNPSPEKTDHFGGAVALDGNRALVGAE